MRNNNRDNPDSRQDHPGATLLRWLLSMPPVARPLIAAFAVGWWLCFLAGAWVENYEMPGQSWWLIIWHGSLGGNSFSAFGALLLKFLLTSEVIIMIFTLAGNRRRVQDAAAKAREEGREEGVEKGVEIGRQAERQEIRQQVTDWYEAAADWYEAAKEDFAPGRDPGPPPILGENGNKPD